MMNSFTSSAGKHYHLFRYGRVVAVPVRFISAGVIGAGIQPRQQEQPAAFQAPVSSIVLQTIIKIVTVVCIYRDSPATGYRPQHATQVVTTFSTVDR